MSKVLPQVGDLASGTVVGVYSNYAILLFDEGWTGLLHISELSHNYIHSFTNFVTIGSIYSVKVIEVDEEKGSVRVSLKRMSTSDKKKAFRHARIHSSDIDFSPLEKQLPYWIEDENKQGEIL